MGTINDLSQGKYDIPWLRPSILTGEYIIYQSLVAVGHNTQIFPSVKCVFHIPLVSGFSVAILRNSFSMHDLSNSSAYQITCFLSHVCNAMLQGGT